MSSKPFAPLNFRINSRNLSGKSSRVAEFLTRVIMSTCRGLKRGHPPAVVTAGGVPGAVGCGAVAALTPYGRPPVVTTPDIPRRGPGQDCGAGTQGSSDKDKQQCVRACGVAGPSGAGHPCGCLVATSAPTGLRNPPCGLIALVLGQVPGCGEGRGHLPSWQLGHAWDLSPAIPLPLVPWQPLTPVPRCAQTSAPSCASWSCRL